MSFKGWDKVYQGNLSEGEGFEKPLTDKWVSIFGDWVKVHRHYTVEIDNLYITPEDEIPEPEDEHEISQKMWVVATSNGETLYYDAREEARTQAREYIKQKYTDEEVAKRKREMKRSRPDKEENYKNV